MHLAETAGGNREWFQRPPWMITNCEYTRTALGYTGHCLFRRGFVNIAGRGDIRHDVPPFLGVRGYALRLNFNL